MLRGMESDALSQCVAKVRGQIKELFLITMSCGLVKIRSLRPLPFTLKEKSFTVIVNSTSDFEARKRFFIFSGMSLQPQLAFTPIMQFPCNVSSDPVVISIVF